MASKRCGAFVRHPVPGPGFERWRWRERLRLEVVLGRGGCEGEWLCRGGSRTWEAIQRNIFSALEMVEASRAACVSACGSGDSEAHGVV